MQPLTSARLSNKMSTDRADLDTLLGETFLAHIAFADDEGLPRSMPTAVARWGERLLTHGSTGSRWLRMIGDGREVCVSLAQVDGLVVARTTFESSVHYRSATILGSFTPVGAGDKAAALEVLTDRLIPGRNAEVRASSAKELAATTIYSMDLDHWSVRISDGWPEDTDADVAGQAWAGVIRFGTPAYRIEAAPDLREGIEMPASVKAFV
ncbi:MAG: pyridoxamine 5'-phosphate oxidase family protein [Nocardioides sp.]